MTTLIKNGTAYFDGAFVKKDILIEDKLITRIEDKIN